MATLDLIEIAKQYPGLKVEISIGDLMEANMLLIAEVKRELEQTIADEKAETYLSRDKVMKVLDVSAATLWRWQRQNYLVPINVRGKRRYRRSDVNRILGIDEDQHCSRK